MRNYVNTKGKIKEVQMLKDENFEQMCRRILIKEGIVKKDRDDSHSLYYGAFCWSDLVEKELSDKYLIVYDPEKVINRLFEIIDYKIDSVDIWRNNYTEIEEGVYVFDIVYDNNVKSFKDIVNEDFSLKKS